MQFSHREGWQLDRRKRAPTTGRREEVVTALQESSGGRRTPTLRDMEPDDFRAAQLAVNSEEQRHALLHACERVLDLEACDSMGTAHDCGFDREACERHISEATVLEGQLDRGCATVAVGLGIAGRVSGSLAALIEAEMRERAECRGVSPLGAQIRRAASLMWTLVALEAEVEREIMPA